MYFIKNQLFDLIFGVCYKYCRWWCYMDKYYKEIKQRIIDDEVYSKAKDYSKEKHKVITYFEIGKLLLEAGNEYGKSVIDNYSKQLISEVGKKIQ